jgi:hypothetical protein
VPIFLRIPLAEARMLADLAVPDDGPTSYGVDRLPVHGEASVKELYELLKVGQFS